jgi:hypothetical protein
MALLRITRGSTSREVPLAASTLLGRHASCTWCLDDPRIPTFWIELRWSEAGWTWRELGADARGPRRQGAGLRPGWWLLEQGQRVNGRGVVVELLDGGPPAGFVVDLSSGDWLQGDDLLQVVCDDTGCPVPADWEWCSRPVRELGDGSTFVVGGKPYRFHQAAPPPSTKQRLLDLERFACQLEFREHSAGPELYIWDGPVEASLRGTFLWALVPYLESRISDVPKDGWLSLDEAHSRWAELVPGGGSSPDRVGQDRSRVRRALQRCGVESSELLFERRRTAERWQVRVGLNPARIGLVLREDNL